MNSEQAPDPILGVAELNALIRRQLEETFPYFKVRGEIASLRTPASGHCYFSLIDGQSQIRAVIWRSTVSRLAARPQEGEAVLITGRLAVYEPRGEYQIIVSGLTPDGAGSERERLLQLHAKLEKEGLFDDARKAPLPFLPEVVGLVTSRTGAALQDILRVLESRFPGQRALLVHAKVQGDGADDEIAAALDALNADGRAEVIICGRGGGSAEDLAWFNSETVVRAIARSAIPVISAVGHEVDVSLADLAADARAPTPTAAAQLAVPEKAALSERLKEIRERLAEAVLTRIGRYRERAAHLTARLRHPRQAVEQGRILADERGERLLAALRQTLEEKRRRNDELTSRLTAWGRGPFLDHNRTRLAHAADGLGKAAPRLLAQERKRLDNLTARLHALSPQAVLERGFAVVRGPTGKILTDPAETAPGDALHVTLARGPLTARVEPSGKTPS